MLLARWAGSTGKPLSDDEFRSLKARKLVQGRRPNLFVSAKIAAATETKESYIRNRAFDKDHYKKLILAYLEKFGEGTRAQIDRLLKDKLSDALGADQKRKFVENLLQEMKREGAISPDGTTRWAKWRMSKPSAKDKIIRTLCAFANDFENLGGGYVVIGQDCNENGTAVFPPVGLPENQLDMIQRELLQYCQLIQPTYFPVLSVEQVEGRRRG